MSEGNLTARERIARRAAAELQNGQVVNLGIGLPALVPRYLGGLEIYLHSENGILGFGPADPDNLDPLLVNAGKQAIGLKPGAAVFDSASSFAMIRGGRIDVAILGALQVSVRGDLANWAVPGEAVLGVGGAMDLARGARRVIVTMTHQDRQGRCKIVDALELPPTALGVVDMIITELAVFRCGEPLELLELQPEVSYEELRARTDVPFRVAAGTSAGGRYTPAQ